MEKLKIKQQFEALSGQLDEITKNDKRPILINLSILSNPEKTENKIKKIIITPLATAPELTKILKQNFVNVENLQVSADEQKEILGDEIESTEQVKNFRRFFDKILKAIAKIKDIISDVTEFLHERNIYISYDPETKEIIIFYQNTENMFPVWIKFKLNISGILQLLLK